MTFPLSLARGHDEEICDERGGREKSRKKARVKLSPTPLILALSYLLAVSVCSHNYFHVSVLCAKRADEALGVGQTPRKLANIESKQGD